MNRNRKKSSYKQKEQPILQHIQELRKTIIGCLLIISGGMIVCYGFFSEKLMGIFTEPLKVLDIPIIYTSVSEALTTEMKVGLLAGIITTLPITCMLIWKFIAPALFPEERFKIIICAFISVLLFGMGTCFCYFEMFPFVLQFFLYTPTSQVIAMPDISEYVIFLCKMEMAFGFVFETPFIICILSWYKIVPVMKLKKIRKYAFLGCFILGAIITPPDIVSQIMIAGPMYLLYESGILVATQLEKLAKKSRKIRRRNFG